MSKGRVRQGWIIKWKEKCVSWRRRKLLATSDDMIISTDNYLLQQTLSYYHLVPVGGGPVGLALWVGLAQQLGLGWPKWRENLGLKKTLQTLRENSQVLSEEEGWDSSQQSPSNSVRVREWEGNFRSWGVLRKGCQWLWRAASRGKWRWDRLEWQRRKLHKGLNNVCMNGTFKKPVNRIILNLNCFWKII